MIRSVTAAIVGFRAMSISLVPADAVPLGQCDRGGWAPSAGRIGSRGHPLLRPGGADSINPRPLSLDLITAHEQRRVSLDQIEQQSLIGNPAAIFAEGIGQANVERNFAQPHALAVQAR